MWLVSLAFRQVELVGRCRVRIQNPITLDETGPEPEPDLVLAVVRDNGYSDRHPYPVEILLVAEVSHSSLAEDLAMKSMLYASAGISEYWVVDLKNLTFHVHRKPESFDADTGYREITVLRVGDVASPLSFPDLHVRISEIFAGP